MGKCLFKAHCKNQNGEVVESILYRDLCNYTSSRKTANELYSVGTNQEFLEQVREQAEFDENGEITFSSLKKLANIEIENEKTLTQLNKEIKAGTYSYEEAAAKIQQFNRNHQLKEDYLATMQETKNGTYRVSVVERSKANESKLHKEIANRNLQDRIIYRLNQLGVNVDFLKDADFFGKYSTVNAEKTAEGLYRLIEVLEGEHLEESLAEEAGHFAIGALGDSPLVQRLQKMLTPELQKKILGEEYETKKLGNNPAREVAGVLVGRALNGEIDKKSPWKSLVDKIVNLAKRVFYTLKRDRIAKDAMIAQEIADKIASGLMSPNFMGDVETALSTKETFYDALESPNVRVYKKVVEELQKQVKRMQEIDSVTARQYKALLEQVAADKNIKGDDILDSAQAIQGIAEAVVLLSDKMIDEIPALLDSVDFNDSADFNTSMLRNTKNLRIVRSYLKTAAVLLDTIGEALKSPAGRALTDTESVQIMDKYGGFSFINLKNALQQFSDRLSADNGIANSLTAKERAVYLKFLESSFGSKYIHRAARIVFKTREIAGKTKRRMDGFKFWKWIKTDDQKISTSITHITAVEAEDIPLSRYLDHMQDDITLFEKWLASMSNSSDVIHQISDKVAKEANRNADLKTNRDWDNLRALKERLTALGVKNTRMFMETLEDGSLSGNIVTDRRWGDWEAKYEEFKKKAKQDFKEEFPDIDNYSSMNKSIIWGDWFKNKVKREFHDIHSTFDAEKNMYVPNIDESDPTKVSYVSDQYMEIAKNDELLQWLKDYMALKTSIDSRLPERSIPAHRAPQFKGTFTNKVRNRKLTTNTTSAIGSTMLTSLRDTFCEECDDTEFGSDQTYDTVEEDTFDSAFDVEMEAIHRVPLYGINKMKDTSQLSTDLFHSTLAYSGMANTHEALSSIVDVMEVGSQVLYRRQVGNTNEKQKSEKGFTSNSYARYQKFLDKQVYLISQPKMKIGKTIVVNKIMNALNSLSRAIFLGYNLESGVVNLGTGTIEIFKEAAAGQFFTLSDWKKAHQIYWSSLPENMMHMGSNFKQDKISLFMRHFNVLNNSRGAHRDWNTNTTRLVNLVKDSQYMQYKLGEHYMQSIAYISLANHIKVYDSYGTEMSLFDAYSKKSIDNPKLGKTSKLKTYDQDLTFKDKESIDSYFLLQDIIDQTESFQKSREEGDVLGNSIMLSYDQEQLLQTYGYTEQDLQENPDVLQDIKHIQKELRWNESDEAAFMNKAREINIRLHGIYNSYDGTVIQQNIYGNLLLSMRQYALGLAQRRLTRGKYNTMLGNESEGTLVTLAKVIVSMRSDKSMGFLRTLSLLLCPFGKKQKNKMLEAGFSETQFHNMKRNLYDYAFITALWALSALTGADDDDDDDTTMGLAHYFVTRWAREQSAFNTIYGIREEGNSAINLVPVAFSGLGYILDTAILIGGAMMYESDDEDYGSRFFYQQDKEGRYEDEDPKYEYKMLSKSPIRTMYLIENPYESIKSYKFGSNVNK